MNKKFAGQSKISDYAKSAAEALSKQGIIGETPRWPSLPPYYTGAWKR